MNSKTPIAALRIGTLALLAILGMFWLAAPSEKIDAIREDELYGIWTLNFSTLDRGEGLRNPKIDRSDPSSQTIELRNDGTCTYNSYADFQPGGRYVRAEGTWSLKKDLQTTGTWFVEFDLRPSTYELVVASFYLKRKDGRVIMYDSFGDLDLQQFVEFERR